MSCASYFITAVHVNVPLYNTGKKDMKEQVPLFFQAVDSHLLDKGGCGSMLSFVKSALIHTDIYQTIHCKSKASVGVKISGVVIFLCVDWFWLNLEVFLYYLCLKAGSFGTKLYMS